MALSTALKWRFSFGTYLFCCSCVLQGLTEKFKEKDKAYTGTGTFSYEDFMLTVLPFLIA